jgi:hypothetical protein
MNNSDVQSLDVDPKKSKPARTRSVSQGSIFLVIQEFHYELLDLDQKLRRYLRIRTITPESDAAACGLQDVVAPSR